MNRSLLVIASALVGAFAAATVRADEYRIEGPAGLPGYQLGIVDGKVRLVKRHSPGSVDWVLETDKDKGVLIRLPRGGWREKYSRWYLSYDVEGKDKEVFLRKEAGPGSSWHVDPQGDKSTDAIAPHHGELKGWFLNAGDGAETLKDNDGKEFTAYKAVLDRTSRPIPLFTFTRLSP
jgi:hypothetical protein